MDNVIRAYLKGYKMTIEGDVISKRGNKLSLFNRGRGRHGTYLAFNFKHAGNKITINAHRLQAFQKFGMRLFEEGMVVRHLDGDSMNNSWYNISIGTASDNMMDIPEDVRKEKDRKAGLKRRKYDYDEVKKFYLESNRSYKKTMEEFNISDKSQLHYILSKE